MESLKHVAVRLDPSFYRHFRLTVVRRNTTIQQAVVDAIQEWLKRHDGEDEEVRRQRISSARGMFARRHPNRMLSRELLAERRLEAERE